MKKTLIVFPHGLGDHVMLTPGLRKYKELNQDTYIALASLGRFGNKVSQLLSGLSYIDEFLPILPDPWNDFDNYFDGMNKLVQQVKSMYLDEFDEIKIIPTNRLDGFRLHKIFRIVNELGVEFNNVEELSTELVVNESALKKADKILAKYKNPILILHNKAGNPPKEFTEDVLEQVCNGMFSGYDILEFGRKSVNRSQKLPEKDMELTKALIYRADAVCAIDSVVMHIAGAFRKNLLALFKSTPVHQAIPLFGNVTIAGSDNENTELSNWEKYKEDILAHFNQLHRITGETGKVLVTGTGHSGGNWVTAIVALAGKYKFTEFVEDRNLFNHGKLPNGYGTKLAIENVGANKKNFKTLLDVNPDLKIIYTMRHPVDNCLSMIYRAVPSDENEVFSGKWIDYHPTGTTIGAIKDIEYSQMILDFLKNEYLDRILVVKLEDLINNTEDEVNKICKFLKLQKKDEMLEAYKYSRNKHHKKRYSGKLDMKQAEIRKHLDSAYNGFFKDKQGLVQLIEHTLKPIITDFGYNNTDNSKGTRSESRYFKLPDFYYQNHNYWAHFITNRCNSKCPYCITNIRGKCDTQIELSGKKILKWWNNIEAHDGHKLSLIGGEPTLHKDLIEIVNNLDGYNITLTTNCASKFFDNRKFITKLKPKSSSSLRINTSFHPHLITPEMYVEIIQDMLDAGYNVDQIMFVNTPDVYKKYKKEIEFVSEKLDIASIPFVGFWNEKDKYNAPRKPEFLMPREEFFDQETVSNLGGIFDYKFYRKLCGKETPFTVKCPLPLLCLLVSPNGNIYSCHYRMYSNSEPICNIENFRHLVIENLTCKYGGFCNGCDIGRMYFGMKNIKFNEINWFEEIK